MQGIRVVWPEPRKAELEQYEVSAPGPQEVLIQTEYTVISAGTEKACLISMPNTSQKFPQRAGYSASGVIMDVGPDVTQFKAGDRVVAYHSPHCSHSVKNIIDVVAIPDDSIPGEYAAFTIIAAMSLHGVRKAAIELGESVMIIGQGLLGLFATQLARIDGALPVIAVDFNEKRLQLATDLGADYALSPESPDFAETIKKITNEQGANAVIEVTGVPEAMHLALAHVAREGRISALGCTRNKVDSVDFYRDIHRPGVSVIGAHNMARPQYDTTPGHWTMRDDLKVLLRLIAAGRLSVAPMIAEITSPQRAPEVYRDLVEMKEPPLGVVFDWRKVG